METLLLLPSSTFPKQLNAFWGLCVMHVIVGGDGDSCICIKDFSLVAGITTSRSISVSSHWDGGAALLQLGA